MPEVMSVTLKANVNSNLVPEGGDDSGKAEGLTWGIPSHVALQLSVAAEHLGRPASESDTYHPKQEALCIFPLDFSLFKILNYVFM